MDVIDKQKTFLAHTDSSAVLFFPFFSYIKFKILSHKNVKVLIHWPFHMNMYKRDDDDNVCTFLMISVSYIQLT